MRRMKSPFSRLTRNEWIQRVHFTPLTNECKGCAHGILDVKKCPLRRFESMNQGADSPNQAFFSFLLLSNFFVSLLFV
jgi:hypothetical protein